MHVSLSCNACQTRWKVIDEPRALIHLTCPHCEQTADPRASEDLASALEDALAQLYRLSRTLSATLTLDTATIPAAFRPPEPGEALAGPGDTPAPFSRREPPE